MKAYIAVSYNKRQAASDVINAIKATLKLLAIEPFVFTDHFQFTAAEETPMMQQAMAAIDSSDILIAETSHKAIGIGVEVGYAKAKHKPVIYMRQKDATHSSTVAGISDFQIFYATVEELQQQLHLVIVNFLKK